MPGLVISHNATKPNAIHKKLKSMKFIKCLLVRSTEVMIAHSYAVLNAQTVHILGQMVSSKTIFCALDETWLVQHKYQPIAHFDIFSFTAVCCD